MSSETHVAIDSRSKRGNAPVPDSLRVWIGGIIVRSLFLIILTVLTARVASPQIEKFRTVIETPDDLIRVVLGVLVCAWIVVHLFILPKDPGAFRTWLYMGIGLLPLSFLCAYVVW
jgi:hypothetical protein